MHKLKVRKSDGVSAKASIKYRGQKLRWAEAAPSALNTFPIIFFWRTCDRLFSVVFKIQKLSFCFVTKGSIFSIQHSLFGIFLAKRIFFY